MRTAKATFFQSMINNVRRRGPDVCSGGQQRTPKAEQSAAYYFRTHGPARAPERFSDDGAGEAGGGGDGKPGGGARTGDGETRHAGGGRPVPDLLQFPAGGTETTDNGGSGAQRRGFE